MTEKPLKNDRKTLKKMTEKPLKNDRKTLKK